MVWYHSSSHNSCLIIVLQCSGRRSRPGNNSVSSDHKLPKNFFNTDKYWPHLNKFLFIEPENHQFRTGSSRQVAGRIKIHFWREG